MITSRIPWVAAVMLGVYGCAVEEAITDEQETTEDRSDQALTTTRLEAEVQTWTTSSGDSVSPSSTAARLQANAAGDSFQFSSSVPAGKYQIIVGYATRSAYGDYQLKVNGASVGSIQGGSTSTSDSWQTATLGTIDLSGSTVFALACTGKASGSTDYDIKIDYIELVPVSGGSTTSASTTSSTSTSGAGGSTSSTSTSSTSGSGGSGGSGGSTIPLVIPTPTNGAGQINTSTTVLKNAANGGQNVYDFTNKKIGVNNTVACDGDSEGQKTVFEVEDGVTVKNLIIAGGLPGGNGIVCKGNCTLDHVYWEDICEDAATNTKDGATMTLNHVIALHATDKVFQHNAKGNSKTIITNSYIADFGKVWRSCGDCTNNGGPRHLILDNVKVEGVSVAIAGANQNYKDTVTITNLFVKGGYDAQKDKPKICTEYIGVTDHNGSSSQVNGGASQWDTPSCNVSKTDIQSW